MALKPWFKVVTPRADLREGKPLDAAEFAVHLDQVRDGRAREDYQDPKRFFERTYMTQSLTDLATQVVRRLSGIKTETSAVFNMATQFGGGKTHSLTLLYHLSENGAKANRWAGVDSILSRAGVKSVPAAAVAVFVGTEFDSIAGRGGKDGTPLRKTPWGEIAYQIGGKKALDILVEHEKQMTAPAGDVIRQFLPKDKPCLILMDELMNYVSRSRKMGMGAQLYSFLQNLSEVARGQDNMVLAVSIPASEMEMTSEDRSDYERLKKLLDRLGKAILMSAGTETSEIIRRRLFEWDDRAFSQIGKVLLPKDATETCAEYAKWVLENRKQLTGWFPIDAAKDTLLDSYPFHPALLSVFERKWAVLPRFQRTRGILRLLALWVSHAYKAGYRDNQKDALIDLGSAPLDDPMFRAAVFEQLGEPDLEAAVTADICGKKDSNAVRLDQEAVEAIKRARLHRKAASAVFFESNGGQFQTYATLPEIRMAVASPDLDIANVETVLDALIPPDGACYYLDASKNRYWFSPKPNMTKILADRKATIQQPKIEEAVREQVFVAFKKVEGVEIVSFPQRSSQISDRPVLTLVVLPPEQSVDDPATAKLIESMTKECGTSARTFKSALIWCAAESASPMYEEAKKLLAWGEIQDEEDELRLDDGQKRQLVENVKKAERDLRESVWRAYRHLFLLAKDNQIRQVELSLSHSGSAESITSLILHKLRQDGEVVKDSPSPNLLTRNWPPAFTEWSTKSVRDAFFASPQFPRLMNPDSIKETIAKGASEGLLGYVGKKQGGKYKPFYFEKPLSAEQVEISDDMFIITAEESKKQIEPPKLTTIVVSPSSAQIEPGKKQTFTANGLDQHGREYAIKSVKWSATGGKIDKDGTFSAEKDEGNFVVTATTGEISGVATCVITKEGKLISPPTPIPSAGKLVWTGEVPPQKWMNFYTKVLSKFAAGKGLKLTVTVEASPEGGVTKQQAEETKTALRELGLNDDVQSS
jgi:Protein of unknown function (DUF499)